MSRHNEPFQVYSNTCQGQWNQSVLVQCFRKTVSAGRLLLFL